MRRYHYFLWLILTMVLIQGAGDSGTFTLRFDPVKGNEGLVRLPAMALERVRSAHVRSACSIEPIAYGPENVFTASDIGLQEGESTAIGLANANALRALATDSTLRGCIVLKLDRMYYVKLPSAIRRGTSYKTESIELPRDMRIDGEGPDGVAVGGFITDQLLFYTEHSLEMHKVRVEVLGAAHYFAFFVNCTHGIDHVVVKGCVFTQASGVTLSGRRFRFFANDQSPFEEGTRQLRTANTIGHILFDGNTCQGKELASSNRLCVLKSWRYIDNTITDVAGVAISHGTENTLKHAAEMAYVSCPVYIVGNKISGCHRVLRVRSSWADYYCAALVENSRAYVLRNDISHFVSTTSIYKGEPKAPATYDFYFMGQQSYFVGNHVTNLVKLSYNRECFGTLKGKGTTTPPAFKANHMPVVRHYTHNTYDIDVREVRQMWKERSNATPLADRQKEQLLDRELVVDDVLTLNIMPYVDALQMAAVDLVDFSHNTIRYPNIGGMEASSYWPCRKFVCTANVFDAQRISSEGYSSRFHRPSHLRTDEYLFVVHHATDIRLRDNVFTSKDAAIRALLYRYSSKLQQAPLPEHLDLRGNKCPPSSAVVSKRLDTTSWAYGSMKMQ